ncbi:MAG: flavodoxin family protein [Lachnospiraceae bacterium]|nr:flavodoxin family protein [Lachnospiraceae bacterium]
MKLIITDIEDFEFQIEGEHKVINPQGNIKYCIGCFGCWAKTPGECVIHDGYQRTSLDMGLCDEMIIISECYYGTVSPFIKNVQDRAISYVQGDFILRNGEMHHKHRYDNKFQLSAYFYGEDITEEEKQTARDIIAGNAENFDAKLKEVLFFKSAEELRGLRL